MESSFLSVLLASIPGILPYTLIYLVGILIAILTWRQHSRLSLLVTITMSLFILIHFCSTVLSVAFPLLQKQTNASIATLALFLGLFNVLTTIPLWGLLFWAIFGWRKPVSPFSSSSEDAPPKL